jgi:hypothetical protein
VRIGPKSSSPSFSFPSESVTVLRLEDFSFMAESAVGITPSYATKVGGDLESTRRTLRNTLDALRMEPFEKGPWG